jgi:hypothetical protein
MKIIFLLLTIAPCGFAQSRPKRHIMILQSSVDTVWGNYMFSAQAKIPYDFVLPLPREQLDFRPDPSFAADDLRLGDDGRVRLSKTLDQEKIVEVSFKAPAQLGVSRLQFAGFEAGEEWQILIPLGPMQLRDAAAWEKGQSQRLGGQVFAVYRRQIAEGEGPSWEIVLEGVGEGRARLWYLGAAVGAALMLLLATYLVTNRRRVQHVV